MLKYNPQLKTRARTLRSKPTDAEHRLWSRLRGKQILAVQFYRQRPIGNYVVDFYAPSAQLVIEVDGAHHSTNTQAQYDRQRADYLQSLGLKVLRFGDRQVLLELEAVVQTIYRVVNGSVRQKGSKSLLTSL